MKRLLLILPVICLNSCIPLRIAPDIETDKVMVAKKFKRKLPKQNTFIFEDPKDANEFYYYVNTKYGRNHNDVEWNVPFQLENNTFYFSFHEVEIPAKTFNILPWLIDAKRHRNGNDPLFEDKYETRRYHWYLVITVSDDAFNDCLEPNYTHRTAILEYLRQIKHEYLNTQNYLEVLLKQ
ncbi:MAG: hypothetical protein ACON5F_15055 [Jejuia sp.]